jgi:hypothetical protein
VGKRKSGARKIRLLSICETWKNCLVGRLVDRQRNANFVECLAGAQSQTIEPQDAHEMRKTAS